jgi:ABC-type transporter Mla maintaining outer membrane lipid asymmetry ATPase subunit MlaF
MTKEIATIMVTHQIVDAFGVADRFIIIEHGEVIFDGTPEELRNSNEPQVQAFLAPFQGSFEMVTRKRYMHGALQDRRND